MPVELLDEQEFDVDPERSAYDENETNSAAELGLLVGFLLLQCELIDKHITYARNWFMIYFLVG